MLYERMDIEIESKLCMIRQKYLGRDVDCLSEEFNITNKCKQLNSMLVKAIFKKYGDGILENKRIVIKTVQVNKYGCLSQPLSFPAFDFEALVKEDWENSSLRKFLFDSTFIFAVFKNNNEKVFFDKLVTWKIPKDILDESIVNVWMKTKKVLLSGNIVKYIENEKLYTNFPSAKENPYMHVRPHSQNKTDVKKLPIPDKITGLISYAKQCFWFNKSYINRVINDSK